MKKLLFISIFVLLGSCASLPFDTKGVDRELTPTRAKADSSTHGQQALWGGMILSIKPMKNVTEIEVLAYPLYSGGSPNQGVEPRGRFLIKHPGFLEPAEFSAGRWITAMGTVIAPIGGQVGESDYLYPAMSSEQLHIWPEDYETRTNTQIHFGIGIRIH